MRLREVDSSVEEGALCEFATLGRTCTRLERELKNFAQDDAAAVTLQLNNIFTRVRFRRTHDKGDCLVDNCARKIFHVPENNSSARNFG